MSDFNAPEWEVVNLIQGSDEWLDFRKGHYPASEAPAVMNDSKLEPLTREDLGLVRLGVKTIEVTDFQRRLFDKGHHIEACARPIIEKMTGEVLSNITRRRMVDGLSLPMSASLDGVSFGGELLFEHKMWNKELAESVKNGVVPPAYYWQLEQQLYVSRAKSVIFVTSDSFVVPFGQDYTQYPYYSDPIINDKGYEFRMAANNLEFIYYEPVSGRIEQLIEGWKLYEQQLDTLVMDNGLWQEAAEKFIHVNTKIKLKLDEIAALEDGIKPVTNALKDYAISLGNQKTVGCGIEVRKTTRKGTMNNAELLLAIAEKLKAKSRKKADKDAEPLDVLVSFLGIESLDEYRKDESVSWSVVQPKAHLNDAKAQMMDDIKRAKLEALAKKVIKPVLQTGMYNF